MCRSLRRDSAKICVQCTHLMPERICTPKCILFVSKRRRQSLAKDDGGELTLYNSNNKTFPNTFVSSNRTSDTSLVSSLHGVRRPEFFPEFFFYLLVEPKASVTLLSWSMLITLFHLPFVHCKLPALFSDSKHYILNDFCHSFLSLCPQHIIRFFGFQW